MPRTPLRMPKMSMTMEEGEFGAWLVSVGDEVEAGQPICEVATDKVDMEVESTATGTVVELLAEPGDTLPVGAPLAWIDAADDSLLDDLLDGDPAEPASPPEPASAPEPAVAEESAVAEEPAPAPAATVEPAPAPPPQPVPARPEPAPPAPAPPSSLPPGTVPALPGARQFAQQNGVDLHSVDGTGPSGAITISDVRQVLSTAPSSPAPAAPATNQTASPTSGPTSGSQAGIQVTVTLSATVTSNGETAHAARMLERIAANLGRILEDVAEISPQ